MTADLDEVALEGALNVAEGVPGFTAPRPARKRIRKRYNVTDPPRVGHWWAREKGADEQGRPHCIKIILVDRDAHSACENGQILYWYGPAFVRTAWSRRKHSIKKYELFERIEMPPHIKTINDERYGVKSPPEAP